MLQKPLEVLLIGLQFTSVHPNLPPPEQYLKHQKPPIYVQTSEDLSTRLLKEADSLAKKNPVVAIPFYERVIIEEVHSKDEAIEKLFDIHKKLLESTFTGNGKYNERSVIENALNFYEKRKKDTDSTHLAKAYLRLGSLLWTWQAPVYFDTAIVILNEAYDLGDKKIRTEASWHLAFIYWNFATGFPHERDYIQKYNLSDVKKHFRKVIQLAPNSEYAKKARAILQTDTFQKTK